MKKPNLQSLLLLSCFLWAGIGLRAQAPVAQYSFTGNAKDLSTFGNDAAVNGAIPTQDRFNLPGRAFYFDGVQSSLRANNASQLNSPYLTVSFWVKVKQLPAQGEVYLLSHGGWQERWKISLPSHGRPVFTTNATAIKDMDTDSVPLPVGVWKHVVAVHDGTNDKIYINGVLKKSTAVAGALNNTAKPFGMGYNPIDSTGYFNGSLDEVTLYNFAMTDAQIAALYTAQSAAPTLPNDRVASYSFNGSGYDSSVYANHATLKNVKATTDRFGFGAKAYEFNGVSSSVTAPNAAELNSPTTTVSFWVKVFALPAAGSEVTLVSFGGWQSRWKISLPGHGKPVFTTNATAISDMDAGDGNALSVGVWKHVVAVHDGTNDKIFINGVKTATKAVAGNLNNTTYPLGIGYSPIDTSGFFNGALDEVQIYNYALADADVAALYTAQSLSPVVATDVVADYKLNGNGRDDSQFKNTATGQSFPAANRFSLGSNATSFTGVDSLVAPNSIALQTDNATISFWVKVNQLPAQGEVYLLSNGGWQERWKISLPSHGRPVFTTNATSIKDMDTDSVPLPVGAWRHVVMTHDGTNNNIYINGVLKKSIAAPGPLNKTKYPLGFAYNPIDGGANFNGSLDDIKIYNRALSDLEIAALYTLQSQAPLSTGPLVAYYPFSNSAADVTPYVNNATVVNAVYTKDRFNKSNKSLAFNNSKVTAANSPQLNSAATTISFWIKVNQLPAQGESYLLSNGGYQERWKISLPSHGKPVFTTNTTAGVKDMDSDSVPLPVGAWRHVVMTHDAATNNIYINGVLKKSIAAPGDLKSTTKPLGIGYDPLDSTSGTFNGSMDEVQIYNIALSATDVAALYAAQSLAPTLADTIPPTVPLGLTAAVAFTNVTLAWLPSTDNVGVAGYNVYRNDTLVLTTGGTTTLLRGLKPTTKFTFAVTAIDSSGNESAKATVQATTGQDQARDTIPPTVPTNLVAQPGSNSVQLTWTASTDNRAVAGYIISQDGVVIDTILAPSTTKFVSGLKPLTAYTFDVLAFDAAGNKSANAEVTITTLKSIDTGEPGLVAYYPFDGNANDATPYANNGVIGGNVTFTTRAGATGQAVKFSGLNDSILVKNAVQLISDYTTFSFWIRVDSINIADAEAYIIDFGHWNQRMKISLPQHTRIVFTTNSKNAQYAQSISDMDSGNGNELVKGVWWYVTMVHDGTNDLIYVNGVLANSKPATGKLNPTARTMGFGNNPVDGGQYFNGALDNLKIYNKALTANEVKNLYKTGTTPTNDLASAELRAFVKSIFPNPTADLLTVQHKFPASDALTVRVFDFAGRQIDGVNFSKNQIPVGQFSLNTSKYPQGAYLINFVQDGKSLGALKFVKN